MHEPLDQRGFAYAGFAANEDHAVIVGGGPGQSGG